MISQIHFFITIRGYKAISMTGERNVEKINEYLYDNKINSVVQFAPLCLFT
jgi:hypothetical protein